VGRGVDHPLGEHDLAGEPPARVGAAEPGGGRRDVRDKVPLLLFVMLVLLVAVEVVVGRQSK
jgi:hypothetical protein